MNQSKALEIATTAYYWKPMAAFFRSLEIRLYLDAGVRFDGPILDLGCGDGGVIHMLGQAGLVTEPACGADIAFCELKKAEARRVHRGVFQADANRLPFRSESFSSIVCNGVLCSIPQGVDPALSEVHRVLKPGGMFVATVPTDRFIDVLAVPRWLGTVSGALRSRYVRGLNARLPHFNFYDPGVWAESFERNGLTVTRKVPFFPPRAGSAWSVLSMQVFRVFGLLKLVRSAAVVRPVSALLRRSFRPAMRPPTEGAMAGYVFIVSRKAGP